jgi:hypothetical protein
LLSRYGICALPKPFDIDALLETIARMLPDDLSTEESVNLGRHGTQIDNLEQTGSILCDLLGQLCCAVHLSASGTAAPSEISPAAFALMSGACGQARVAEWGGAAPPRRGHCAGTLAALAFNDRFE